MPRTALGRRSPNRSRLPSRCGKRTSALKHLAVRRLLGPLVRALMHAGGVGAEDSLPERGEKGEARPQSLGVCVGAPV